jgi:alanyl-tRNA synthetase
MTSAEIRRSFLDFFREKQHTIVPSSSLLPDAPNLLFTNAGMNQFVPIFLGQQKPQWKPPRVADTQKCIRAGGKHNDLEDVGFDTYHHTFFEMLGNWSFGDYFKKEAIEWAWELLVERWKFPAERLYATVLCPHMNQELWFDELDAMLANVHSGTIVDGDKYRHHFLDELITKKPAFAGLLHENSDMESAQFWARVFITAGLDPKKYIIAGSKEDNLWMMGDTGPCGPCSEIHVDLTQERRGRELVNKNDPRCIEIWNLVFIQFNANSDGTFTPLPQRHVDTGMGFERAVAIIQGTKSLTDLSRTISNYETDVFRPIFDELEKLSGKKYASTLPTVARLCETPAADTAALQHQNDQEKIDIAFRVIADHIRALSFAIADGIIPSNEGRGYVLRRILRRAVRYGRTLDFHEPFFFKLVDVVAKTMGGVFPEVRTQQSRIKETIRREEEGFNTTLDQGILAFETIVGWIPAARAVHANTRLWLNNLRTGWPHGTVSAETYDSLLQFISEDILNLADALSRVRLMPRSLKHSMERLTELTEDDQREAIRLRGHTVALDQLRLSLEEFERFLGQLLAVKDKVSGEDAFLLYDTYGFPSDLTQLMARERGLSVDVVGFEDLMQQQRARGRESQKKEIVEASATGVVNSPPTVFVGYEKLDVTTKALGSPGEKWLIVERTPFYATMGGQITDTGIAESEGRVFEIKNVRRVGTDVLVHWSDRDFEITLGSDVRLVVDADRRHAIERHHTVTHLLHWALHEVVSRDASQKGSYVGPDKLTFDFSSAPLTKQQLRDVQELVNQKIEENALVSPTELPYAEAKQRKDIIQFFGEKYGDTVRVLQIGGAPRALDGYSMELCGGTHVSSTGEIGPFRIVKEEAIAAGTRRIEAVAGDAARAWAKEEAARQQEKFERLARRKPDVAALPVFESEATTTEMLQQIDARAAQLEKIETEVHEWEKQSAKAAEAELRSRAAQIANELARSHASQNFCVAEVPDADGKLLQAVVESLKTKIQGPIFLVGTRDASVALVAYVPPPLITKFQANKLIQQIAPIVGGKGGGRPESAQGAGKDPSKIDVALARARELLGAV